MKSKTCKICPNGKLSLLWRLLRGSKSLFFLSILFTALTALADMIIPQIIRVAVDHVIGSQPLNLSPKLTAVVNLFGGLEYLKRNLWIMAAAVVAVAFVKVISQYLFRVCNTAATETMVKNTRDSLFSHIEHLPYSWHVKNRTGDLIQRCTSDIDTVKGFMSKELTVLFRIVVLLILSVVFMVKMHLPLALIALIPTPMIIANSIFFDLKIEAAFREYDENEGKLSAMLQENLTGARVVRAFGREKSECIKFHQLNSHYTNLGNRVGRILSLFWSSADILAGLQIMLVIVFGAWFCIRNTMTAGAYIAFISYNTLLTWPLSDLGKIITEFSQTSVSIDRILYIMGAEEERDRPDTGMPDLNGDIVFDHVTFAYENCPPVLKNINFTVKAGTTLGILGGTGSGKSTLILLLDKLYPISEGCGKITIGGVNIADINTEYLRKNMGIVLQDPYLFSRTIAENIGITQDDLSLAEIRKAAEAACLDETVSSFAKGYDTFVGERGVTLSGGQKQRTAIARILTQHPPIMIFDDSMSAVDTETDAKIRESLEDRFGSASIILISHRITTLSKADQIIVLDNGTVVEQGTHQQLIEGTGLYRKIYEIQSGGKKETK